MAVQTRKLKKNVEGFYQGATFHPIRKSEDYDGMRAGDYDNSLKRTAKLLRMRTQKLKMKKNSAATTSTKDRYFVEADPKNKKLFCVKRQKAGAALSQFVKRNLSRAEAGEFVQYFNREGGKLQRAKAARKNPPTKTATAKKRTTAKKTEQPRKNGILSAIATAAVGTSAALNVYDRLNRNTKTPTPSASGANTVLRHNKAKTKTPQASLFDTKEYQETLFEESLAAIENGDFSKVKSAKLHGKLANWSDREVDYFINQAKWTSQLKLNPSAAVIKSAENSLLKQNGFIKRKWARHKAASAYRRELKLQSAIDRAKKKRAGYEAKAKKNPFDAYESFQGRPSTKTVEVVTPKGAPKNLYCLGKLLELRLKGAEDMNFRRENSGKTFYICADEQNKQLWISGGKVAKPDNSIKDGFSEPIALITHIAYETKKVHLNDTKTTGYIHKFGEEGGQQPTLAIDNAGFPIIVGGDYSITSLGIAN